jgi:hypothetical protein
MALIERLKGILVILIACICVLTLTTVLRDAQLGIGVEGLNRENFNTETLISALIVLSVLLNFRKKHPLILNQNISVIYGFATTLFYSIIYGDIVISLILGIITLLKLFAKYLHLNLERVLVLSLSVLSIMLLLNRFQLTIITNIILAGALMANIGMAVLSDKKELFKNFIINFMLTALLFLTGYLENSNIQLSYFMLIIAAQASLFIKLLGNNLLFKLAFLASMVPIFFLLLSLPNFHSSDFDINFENLNNFTPNLSQIKLFAVFTLTFLQLLLIEKTRQLS